MDDGWHWIWKNQRDLDVYAKAFWMIVRANQFGLNWTRPLSMKVFTEQGPMSRSKAIHAESMLELRGLLRVDRRGKGSWHRYQAIRPQGDLYDPKSNPALYPESREGQNTGTGMTAGVPGPNSPILRAPEMCASKTKVYLPDTPPIPSYLSVKKDSALPRGSPPKIRKQNRIEAELSVGMGPRPEDYGVRVNPAALERILARQRKAG